jgi:hypothetical protein
MLTEIGMCRQISVKLLNIKFIENPFSGSRITVCGQKAGQIDMARLIGPFLQLLVANTPKSVK